jgi:hypothetical protein
MLETVLDGIASEWCRATHGGGQIMRDPSGRVNWQCSKCGRWAQPVPEQDERALVDRDLSHAGGSYTSAQESVGK